MIYFYDFLHKPLKFTLIEDLNIKAVEESFLFNYLSVALAFWL